MNNEKLISYVNEIFAPYDGIKSVTELKADLLAELAAQGQDEDTAWQKTIDSIGDIDQTVQEVANLSRSLERQVRVNLSAFNLQESDFVGVVLHKAQFKASAMRQASFAGADLTGSSFEASDVRDANFDGANLTDCSFYATDLAEASFHQSVLVRTRVNVSTLKGAKFQGASLTDVTLSKSALRTSTFEQCLFSGVDFTLCDLRGVHFDDQTFIGVHFDRSALEDASFRGATLKNVAFRLPFSMTNKSYRAFQSVCFDGAKMDKVTYAALKSMGLVDLSKVTIL